MPRKSSGKLARGNEHVVNLEQDLQPVALAGKLDLISLRSFVIERVIDGHGNLAADALHELQFRSR